MLNKKKILSKTFFPIYSRMLDQINHNALVNKWITEHKNLPILENRKEFYEYINTNVLHNQPIEYLEFGVFKGTTIRHWMQANTPEESRFYGFDSFEGLPESWYNFEKGMLNTEGKVPETDDPRVQFVKGWFQDSLPDFLAGFRPRNRLVVHNDSDLYSSTLYTLAKLDPFIESGSVLIFDEFCSPLDEFRAFHDYTNAFRRTAKPVALCGNYANQAAFVFE